MKFLAIGKKLEKLGILIPLALTNNHNNYEQLSVLMSKDKDDPCNNIYTRSF